MHDFVRNDIQMKREIELKFVTSEIKCRKLKENRRQKKIEIRKRRQWSKIQKKLLIKLEKSIISFKFQFHCHKFAF